ncbi:MAG: hypothetical protein JST00_46785 [Deltaproteobacteria bacterium]|nr:hypothetical protein [Deltaproteobacteria bacterium]
MLKQEEKIIGGYRYKVTQLDAVKGRRAFMRLMKVVGPAYSKGATSGIEGALEDLVSRLSEDDVDHFCDVFAKTTQVSGGDLTEGREPFLRDIFMFHFAGRYLEMVQWLVFCCEVNFASFFAQAASLLAAPAAAAKAESASTSPST